MRFNVHANYNGTYPENVLTASASYFAVAVTVTVANADLNQGSFIHTLTLRQHEQTNELDHAYAHLVRAFRFIILSHFSRLICTLF